MSKKPSRAPANAAPKSGAGDAAEEGSGDVIGDVSAIPGEGAGEAGRGARREAPSPGPMDPRLLEQIVKLMAANDLNTVDVRDGQRRVILKRGPAVTYAAVAAPQGSAVPAPAAAPPAAHGPAAGTPASGASGGSGPAAANEDAGLVPIKSEMVGTFYSKPSPDAKPFVSVGSPVDEETVVCVIEAMKHFNPVKAEVRGTIARVLVADGEVVDVDKPLFLVKPS